MHIQIKNGLTIKSVVHSEAGLIYEVQNDGEFFLTRKSYYEVDPKNKKELYNLVLFLKKDLMGRCPLLVQQKLAYVLTLCK